MSPLFLRGHDLRADVCTKLYRVWLAIFLPTALLMNHLWDTPGWDEAARRIVRGDVARLGVSNQAAAAGTVGDRGDRGNDVGHVVHRKGDGRSGAC